MQYICLVYHDETVFQRMSASEIETMQREAAAYDERLEKEGKIVMARPLKLPHSARTVRVRAKKRHVTDGPFAETKEQLIGFILIEAGSMDEAVELAGMSPLAKTGFIEVRGISFHGDPDLEQPKG
ncbi:YciI family protein [Mesorhizobium sp. ASY16-5R]|uniref:YciI family protein n=1 Tax=Mesorhizobium sp. ASY16-5R TaxID=3445772 RepID=UPI003F9F632E